MKRELADTRSALNARTAELIQARGQRTKAQQDAAEWRRRFDDLLARVPLTGFDAPYATPVGASYEVCAVCGVLKPCLIHDGAPSFTIGKVFGETQGTFAEAPKGRGEEQPGKSSSLPEPAPKHEGW